MTEMIDVDTLRLIPDAARELYVPEKALRLWVRRRLVPSYRYPGTPVMVALDQVRAYMAAVATQVSRDARDTGRPAFLEHPDLRRAAVRLLQWWRLSLRDAPVTTSGLVTALADHPDQLDALYALSGRGREFRVDPSLRLVGRALGQLASAAELPVSGVRLVRSRSRNPTIWALTAGPASG